MNNTRSIRLPWVNVIISILAILLAPRLASTSALPSGTPFVSPFSTPPAVQSSAPLPSAEAQIVRSFVAKKYGIPPERLLISDEHRREYPELGRAFKAMAILEPGSQQAFQMMVDLKDGTVVEDIAAIERDEENAARKKYGKMEPALYERLQTATDDELINVAVWIVGKPQRSREELLADLATKFPESKAAVQRSGKPFDVSDAALGAKIEQAYQDLQEANTKLLIGPLMDYLRSEKYSATSFGSFPSIVVKIPKRTILALSDRSDVGRLFLLKGKWQPLLDTVIPSDRAPTVWQVPVEVLPLLKWTMLTLHPTLHTAQPVPIYH